MKLISLSHGLFAQVDDEDFEYLNQFKWKLLRINTLNYSIRYGKNGHYLMHREIMKIKKNEMIDHKDRNGLNNQKNNLRIATRSQNGANRKSCGSSNYLGVSKNLDYRKNGEKIRWRTQIQKNGIKIKLGSFKTEIEAAKAYDLKAKELHGEFANLNFK